MMKKRLLLFGFLIITTCCFSQKEAYNWYFGERAAVDFNTGTPVSVNGNAMSARQGCTTLSDKNGNLLFYSNGERVWNSQNMVMGNGEGLFGSALLSQPAIAFEVPGNPGSYYLITIGNSQHPGCYYSIINMSLNGGKGDVLYNKKNVFIPGTEDARNVVMAFEHANHKAYWLILRSVVRENKLLSYLFDGNGVNSDPVISTTLKSNRESFTDCISKISPDGKYFCYTANDGNTVDPRMYELYTFNNLNGKLSGLFNFAAYQDQDYKCYGIEFSPDSKRLYTSIITGAAPTYTQGIVQFTLGTNPNQDSFEKSGIVVYHENIANEYCNLQLGPDGKIYVANNNAKNSKFLSLIKYPTISGSNCEFQKDTIKLMGGSSTFGLPIFAPSYLSRFYWKGNCFGDTTYFTSRVLPSSGSIHWNFGDPASGTNNESSDKNPSHIFTAPATYIVTATLGFGHGAVEEITREVTIAAYPSVGLGEDFSVCPGESAILSPGLVIGIDLLWNNGETSNSITVQPPGEYWIRGENRYGCISHDTIQVTNYAPPTVDDTNLQYILTSCGGSNGAISGLVVNGAGSPIYSWKDASGATIGNTLDIAGLAPGSYDLWIQDGHGCITFLKQYQVADAGNDLIEDAYPTPAYCGALNGEIFITPKSLFLNKVEYSIDGVNWSLSGHLIGLAPTTYYAQVRVKDNPGCVAAFAGNPLTVQAFNAPVIDSVPTHPEIDNNSNGSVEIFAQGTGFMYTLTGFAPQSSPIFSSLAAGSYTYTVTDENGCSFQGSVTVGHISSVNITAFVGNDQVCRGEVANVPITMNNFTGVKAFRIVLNYDPANVECQNYYTNVHPSIEANLNFSVDPLAGEIVISWNSNTPVTLNGTITLLELVFSTIQPGSIDIVWDSNSSESWFTGEGGTVMNPTYSPGQVIVNSAPTVYFNNSFQQICIGSPVTITATVNPTGNYNFMWVLPNGGSSIGPQVVIPYANAGDAGQYQLIVNDISSCSATAFMNLSVIPLPNAGFPPPPDDTLYFNSGEQYLIEANPNYMNYLWSTGETGSSIWVTEPGTYSVYITDAAGCANTSYVTLDDILNKPFYFRIPNSFTPERDGLNDYFKPVTDFEQITFYSLKVFSRWGQLVFHTNTLNEGWDGLNNGSHAPRGTYIYELIYSKQGKRPVRQRGTVYLMQ